MPRPDETPGRWRSLFALDARSLAAFRVALGVILLADLATRASDFAIMYGPGGAAPVDFIASRLGPGEWSLHLLSPTAAWQAMLMMAAALSAALLTVGCWTRAATFGCWLLTASLHARLPIVLNAGDDLLRALLFWSLFLPLGAAWSVDARRRGRVTMPVGVSAGMLALTCQLAIVYWCAGLTKLNAQWLGGDALEHALSLGHYSRPAGEWLLQLPALLRLLNWGAIALELAGPCLLFVPWQAARCRTIAVAAFVAFHLGIAATIHVGLFAWVGAAAWLAMIPAPAWDRLFNRDAAARRGEAAAMDGPRSRWTPPSCAAVMALALVIVWNGLDLLGRSRAPFAVAAIRPAMNATGLRQSWRLFSEPAQFDAWFVYRGRLKNGETVDLLRGAALKPAEVFPASGQEFANHRWRKLHTRVALEHYAAYRQPLADAVYHAWNDRHSGDEQAVQLKLVCIRRRADTSDPAGGLIQVNLANVGRDSYQGNFADALRELEN